jgi:beta-lactamase superfamily II metal-dependent hydrolase
VTTPASSIDAPTLEVHVLGGSKGESIVLKLPDGHWGVVDCYAESATDPGTNPTTQFLRGRGVTSLLFVCLTHPHDDHFLGMVKLLEEFRPREFWRFGCLSHEHIHRLIRYQMLQARSSQSEELTRSAQELLDIFAQAREGVVKRSMTVCRATSRMTLYPPPADRSVSFRIECLSPTGRQAELYEKAIFECIGPDGQIARKLPHSQHNDVSVVLRIVYGDTRVVLGGDLEAVGWADVISETGGTNLEASAVKVSHHGSENGYCDGLWEHFAAAGKPIAVITPAHRYKLPKPTALTHISGHARAIYATCRPRLDWRVLHPGSGPGAPLESRLAIRETFSTIPATDGTQSGRCSLKFDAAGEVDIELLAPALTLMP